MAKRAGVKTIAKDCMPTLKSLLEIKLNNICQVVATVNKQKGTKTVMQSDVYDALHLMGINVAETDEF